MNDMDVLLESTWIDPINVLAGVLLFFIFGALFMRNKK